ncbi:acyltransferase family protein [Dyadobacter tibetensis]|uniref:acyltransferase family protein n=1 Tax=Dyadobacter tibetensis TaxID=1211851 RepID=UPI0004AE899D|nr:DUF5009 domain-containing protein [Dyadobacter tibetensis]
MTSKTLNPAPQRVASVDAFRGFVMFLMMAEVLNLSAVSKSLPESEFWSFLAWHQSHVPWVGCSLHDLIQPSFSFLVGVALPYSMASRSLKNQSKAQLWAHTLRRSLILILLGIFLRSMHASQTNFTFEDTLTQIGLGYPFLFALGFCSQRFRWITLSIILVGYWLAFALYPIANIPMDPNLTGVPNDWPHHLKGFAAHWNKNYNVAWAFDTWFMNLFPRESPFLYNGGGYSTLSFIPTLGTMILGLLTGQWLRSSLEPTNFLKKILATAGALFLIAIILDFTGINPIVKRIWTPSWTLYSGAWAMILLSFFYYFIDYKSYNRWSHPLIVVGTNSIAAYVIAHTLNDLIDSSFRIHVGNQYDTILGLPYRTLISGSVILLLEYWILNWMFNKRIFIKV